MLLGNLYSLDDDSVGKGRITLDGVNVADINPSALRQVIGVVNRNVNQSKLLEISTIYLLVATRTNII